MQSTGHREFSRDNINFPVMLSAPGVALEGICRNISLSGLFVACASALPQGSECQIKLILGDGRVHIQATGQVARSAGDGMGIEFIAMDPDSFGHLRHLVQYNATDLDQVQEEIDSHLGFKTRIL